MRWGSDEVGIVLTRNEIWLLLHALAESRLPLIDWEGNSLEPWVVGELKSRLQAALHPDPLSDVEERPIIRLDSDMGRSLAMANVRPQVIEDGYDLGSLFAACAERGWGAELRLPAGGGPSTPAEAVVTVGIGSRSGSGAAKPQQFVGLERPVVAFARALVGAAFCGDEEQKSRENRSSGEAQPIGLESNTDRQDARSSSTNAGRDTDEHLIYLDAIAPGERESTIDRMAKRGWDLVKEADGRLVFRRPHPG
jgi:hypothetical protein